MSTHKNLFQMSLFVAFMVGTLSGCCPMPGGGSVTVTVNSPVSGSTVMAGQATLIDSTATSGAGIAWIELSIDGAVVRRDAPPEGNPTTFRVSQPWTPETEGPALISVVALDLAGHMSPAASVTLQVVGSGAAAPAPTPVAGATEPPTLPPVDPTEPPPPPVTTAAGCMLNSSYVADVSIPDGTEIGPGAAFVKTWRVRNSGTCNWETGDEMIFISGDQMGGPAGVALPPLAAGAEAEVSASLVAPSAYGIHKGTWRMRAADGTVFGTNLTVVIVVPMPVTDEPPAATDDPSVTDEPSGGPTDEPPVTDTPEPTDEPPAADEPYTEYVVAKTTIASGAEGGAIATCPEGSVVVGGGFSTNPDVIVHYNSLRVGNAWEANARNVTDATRNFGVYAVCLHNVPGASVTWKGGVLTAEPGKTTYVGARCPEGSIPTGGGWMTDDKDGGLYIFGSSILSDGLWRVAGKNGGESEKKHISSYVICLSVAGAESELANNDITIPANDAGPGVATCPEGSLLTGGGFEVPAAYKSMFVYNNSPTPDGGWKVGAKSNFDSSLVLRVYAVCLSLP